MRKLIVQEMVSIDGYFTGPDGEIDWHVVDEEFNLHAIDLLNNLDTILFGRVTYQLFEGYWPAAAGNPLTSKSDLEIARQINHMNKIVFSKSMKNVSWEKTVLMNEIISEKILKMKEQPGKDMVIFGSGSIVAKFADNALIDEYWIIVAPVALGKGRALFAGIKDKLNLKLFETKRFQSGNILLKYQPGK